MEDQQNVEYMLQESSDNIKDHVTEILKSTLKLWIKFRVELKIFGTVCVAVDNSKAIFLHFNDLVSNDSTTEEIEEPHLNSDQSGLMSKKLFHNRLALSDKSTQHSRSKSISKEQLSLNVRKNQDLQSRTTTGQADSAQGTLTPKEQVGLSSVRDTIRRRSYQYKILNALLNTNKCSSRSTIEKYVNSSSIVNSILPSNQTTIANCNTGAATADCNSNTNQFDGSCINLESDNDDFIAESVIVDITNDLESDYIQLKSDFAQPESDQTHSISANVKTANLNEEFKAECRDRIMNEKSRKPDVSLSKNASHMIVSITGNSQMNDLIEDTASNPQPLQESLAICDDTSNELKCIKEELNGLESDYNLDELNDLEQIAIRVEPEKEGFDAMLTDVGKASTGVHTRSTFSDYISRSIVESLTSMHNDKNFEEQLMSCNRDAIDNCMPQNRSLRKLLENKEDLDARSLGTVVIKNDSASVERNNIGKIFIDSSSRRASVLECLLKSDSMPRSTSSLNDSCGMGTPNSFRQSTPQERGNCNLKDRRNMNLQDQGNMNSQDRGSTHLKDLKNSSTPSISEQTSKAAAQSVSAKRKYSSEDNVDEESDEDVDEEKLDPSWKPSVRTGNRNSKGMKFVKNLRQNVAANVGDEVVQSHLNWLERLPQNSTSSDSYLTTSKRSNEYILMPSSDESSFNLIPPRASAHSLVGNERIEMRSWPNQFVNSLTGRAYTTASVVSQYSAAATDVIPQSLTAAASSAMVRSPLSMQDSTEHKPIVLDCSDTAMIDESVTLNNVKNSSISAVEQFESSRLLRRLLEN